MLKMAVPRSRGTLDGAVSLGILMSNLWHFQARTSGSIPYTISCISLRPLLYETAWFGEGCLDVQLRSRAQALRGHPPRERSREGSSPHFPPASGHKRRLGRNPNQNGLPRQEVRGCPQRLAGCGLGHSKLSHLYGTCSKQVRHLRQTNHAGVGNGEEGKPVHEECFVAKIRLSRHNPPATE